MKTVLRCALALLAELLLLPATAAPTPVVLGTARYLREQNACPEQ